MGDRGNIYVKETATTGVWLYTHWTGHDVANVAYAALAKRWRWNDGQYLARILLNELQGDDRRETGFGISTVICDNEHPIVVVDPGNQAIGFAPEPDVGKPPKPEKVWSFDEYVGFSEEQVRSLFDKAER